MEYTWEEEENYIAKILLIHAMAIFDTWVDSFIDSTLHSISEKKLFKVSLRQIRFRVNGTN